MTVIECESTGEAMRQKEDAEKAEEARKAAEWAAHLENLKRRQNGH